MTDEIQDSIVDAIDDSEVAELLVVAAALAYLAAVEFGVLASDPLLRMTALMVIAAAVGLDTLVKRLRRKAAK